VGDNYPLAPPPPLPKPISYCNTFIARPLCMYARPPTPILYGIHYTILVTAISCKGQVGSRAAAAWLGARVKQTLAFTRYFFTSRLLLCTNQSFFYCPLPPVLAALMQYDPTWGIRIDVFLWRTRRNMNSVFRLVNPVYHMNTYLFKVAVLTKQAKSEYISRILFLIPRIPRVGLRLCTTIAQYTTPPPRPLFYMLHTTRYWYWYW